MSLTANPYRMKQDRWSGRRARHRHGTARHPTVRPRPPSPCRTRPDGPDSRGPRASDRRRPRGMSGEADALEYDAIPLECAATAWGPPRKTTSSSARRHRNPCSQGPSTRGQQSATTEGASYRRPPVHPSDRLGLQGRAARGLAASVLTEWSIGVPSVDDSSGCLQPGDAHAYALDRALSTGAASPGPADTSAGRSSVCGNLWPAGRCGTARVGAP